MLLFAQGFWGMVGVFAYYKQHRDHYLYLSFLIGRLSCTAGVCIAAFSSQMPCEECGGWVDEDWWVWSESEERWVIFHHPNCWNKWAKRRDLKRKREDAKTERLHGEKC